MQYRKYYLQQTGLKLKKNIHIHHIDANRRNNELSNLIHVPQKTHIRYHYLIDFVNNVILTCKANEWDYKMLDRDDWEGNYYRDFCIPICLMNTWYDKLFTIEKYFIKNMHIRNKLTGITYKNVFLTKEQRLIINIYKRHAK